MTDPMILILFDLWLAASLALGVAWALGGWLLGRPRSARRGAELAVPIGRELEDQPA